jgi:hypothetical protein
MKCIADAAVAAVKVKKARDYYNKLQQVALVLRQQYKGTKLQLKPLEVRDGTVVEAILVCKWGGEMTHAGIGQAHQYGPVFWDEMLRPPFAEKRYSYTSLTFLWFSYGPSDKSVMTTAFQNSGTKYGVEMTSDKRKRLSDPSYRRARMAFLRNMQIYTSDEARVKSTAKAFLLATATCHSSDGKITPDPTLFMNVHANDEVQTFLDDIPPQAKSMMRRATRKIKALVTSTVSFFLVSLLSVCCYINA